MDDAMVSERSASEAHAARIEGEVFSILSRCLLRPVLGTARDVQEGKVTGRLEDLLDRGSSDAVSSALDDIRFVEHELAKIDLESARLALEVEYNRLFVGPGHVLAPPYESYWDSELRQAGSGRLRTAVERDVARAYAACGLEVPRPLAELPDHMAIELEFLSHMAVKEAEAWEEGDGREAARLSAAAEEFAREHPRAWAGAFSERVREGARMRFYPALSSLAALLV